MDDLHELIHSLQPVEKRYIKRMAGETSTRHVELFDAINAQAAYDEAALREHFRAKGWFKNFAEAKRYLTELVLRGLRQYNEGRNPHLELFNLLKEVEILFYKGHYRLMDKRLRYARKLAEEAQRPLLMIQVLRWEHRLATVIPASGPEEIPPAERLQAVMDTLAHKPDLMDLEGLVIRTFHQHGYPCSDEAALAGMRKAIDELTASLKGQKLSFEDQNLLEFADFTYHIMAGNTERAYAISSQSAERVFSLPPKAQADKLIAITNLFHSQISMTNERQRYEEVLAYVQRFEQWLAQPHLKRAKAPLSNLLSFALLNQSMRALLYLGRAEELAAKIGEAQSLLTKLLEGDTHHSFLSLRLAEATFSLGRYADSKAIAVWLQEHGHLRADIQNMLQILRLMVEYSLGNIELGEHLFRQSLHKLRRTELNTPEDRRLLVFFRKLFEADTQQAARDSLARLAEHLHHSLNQAAQTKTRSEILLLLAWVEGQLAGTPLIEQIAATRKRYLEA